MDLNLAGKVAIVTGGSSGIGRKVCHTFAEEGAHAVIFGRREAAGQRVVEECNGYGTKALYVHADVRDEKACIRGVRDVINVFGKVDVMVHAAAPYTDGCAVKPLFEQEEETSRDFADVILWGCINMSRAVLPHMFENCYGRLLFVCSDAGRTGDAYQPVYAACKAATVGWAKSMALYGGSKNVLSNVVSPALTITDENEAMLATVYGAGTEGGMKKLAKNYPTGRLATAQDLANMIVYLASDRCQNVTGQVVGVNGGYFMPSC